MKLLLVVLLGGVVADAANVPQLYYHESIGVPEAARIKLAEENAVNGQRIVGGWDASLGAYPYMGGLVILLTTGASSVCGSTLVTSTRVLTAAHCWWDGRNQGRRLTVVLGSTLLFSGGIRHDTRDVYMHTNWNPTNLANDIAIITIPFTNSTATVQPVKLPSDADINQGSNSFAGLWGIAIGYGRTSDHVGFTPYQYLSRVNQLIISNGECQQSFGNIISHSRLCTSSATGSPCGGDSGGPLVIITDNNEHVLVGLISFGLWSCHQALPSTYTRVTWYEPWLRLYL